jgi:hypothetical protein
MREALTSAHQGSIVMNDNLENRIRERAYEIWTAHGCVEGQADHHWLTAEREILATPPAPTPAARKRVPPTKKRRQPARAKKPVASKPVPLKPVS